MPRVSLSLQLLLSLLFSCLIYGSATGRPPPELRVSVTEADLSHVAWQAPIAARFTPTDSLASWTTTGAAAQQQQRSTDSRPSVAAAAAAVPDNKQLLLDQWDVLLLVLTAITLFIAAGGGIGGGAVFVVLNVFLGGFSAAQAVALSNITILGGSLANFAANSRRRHPLLQRPLIDWDLILVMEPTTMLGALLGGYMNKLLPVWLTSCLLAALLLLLTWKLLRRGTATFIAESRIKRQQAWQQQEQGQGKQQRRRALPAATGTQEQPLTEPLLLEDEVAEGGSSDDDAGAGAGADTRRCSSATGGEPCSSSPAWLDASLTDQQQLQQQQEQQQQQQQQQQQTPVAAEAAESVVVPVPAHLRPLSIMSHEESLAQEQQQQQQGSARAGSSASARAAVAAAAAAAATTAAGGDHTPPLIWSVPASATASFAAAAEAAEAAERQSLLWGSSGQQQQHQQQQRRLRWGLSRCCPWLSPSTGSLSAILASEARQLPWQPLVTLLLLSAWVVASDTLKGRLHCGSLGYWLVAASIVPPALFVTLVVRHWLLAKTAVKAAAAEACVGDGSAAAAAAPGAATHAAAGGSIHWTPKNSVVYPLMCSAAGVVAGLFGVGGGIIKGPLMLELGVCPEVSAATSATMIMFTAGSAAVVYWHFGAVVSDWAAALACVGFVMTLVGQLATVRLVKALGRRSLIVFMMGALMVLASAAAGFQSVRLVRAALARPGSMWTWGSICS